MRVLNYSLDPKLHHRAYIYEFYESIYIENRIDFDCLKTFFLLKFKIHYNFIFENNFLIL